MPVWSAGSVLQTKRKQNLTSKTGKWSRPASQALLNLHLAFFNASTIKSLAALTLCGLLVFTLYSSPTICFEEIASLFCILTDLLTLLSSTSVWGHRWPYSSPLLLLLPPFLPLIVPFVLSFPLPASYSSFSCQFLLTFLPPSTSSYSFYSLLILLLLQPPPCTCTRTVEPFLLSVVLFDFVFPFFSAFLSFPFLFSFSVFYPHLAPSAFYVNLVLSLIPLHLSFLFFSTSFSVSLTLSLSTSLLSIYYRQLRKTEESFGAEPGQTLISNQTPPPLPPTALSFHWQLSITKHTM